MGSSTVSTRSLLAPEGQLLLLTAGGAQNDDALRDLLAADLSWPKLCFLAERENASAIIARRLQTVAPERLAGDDAGTLRKLAMVAEFKMLALKPLLRETVGALRGRRIEVMLLKGSALAYTAYSSFTDRPMGDLDLLVPAEQARNAWSLVQEHGWTRPAAERSPEPYPAHHHLPTLVHPRAGGAGLEIHDAILPPGHPFRLPSEHVWSATEEIGMDDEPVRVPDAVHRLLHLCLHFAWSHAMQWGAWRSFRDVDAMVGRGQVAWPTFVDLARESRAATCCFWTLRLARNLSGASIPRDVLEALHPPRPAFLMDWFERQYVLRVFRPEGPGRSVWLERRLWELGMLPRWSAHGRARPWHGSERWLGATTSGGR
jgi:hypothetical protein